MDKKDTLDAALPPVPTTLRIGDVVIELIPIRLGEIPALMKLLRPLLAQALPQAAHPVPDWGALFAEHSDAMLKILSTLSRQPIEWVRALDLDEGLRLAEALFAANVDFFVRRVMPQIQRITQHLAQMTSNASSAADTVTAT